MNVHARTIRPDGKIAEFGGKAYNKEIVKARGVKYVAKTFTLPDVQIGSILEYYYTSDLKEYYVFDSHWILSHELFTKSAKFSLKPYGQEFSIRWTWNQLPAGTAKPVQGPDKVIRLEASNIAAFQTEDYMPPENELKCRVDFIYSLDAFEKEPAKYWAKFDKRFYGLLNSYVGKQNAMVQAVNEITAPSDTPEVKLRKLYSRVQQIRNTSYEQDKTEQEEKRSKEKLSSNVEAVWKKQYGEKWEINWLFLALARAAGFEADGMWVSDRLNYFFSPGTMDSRRLDENVVVVKLNDKDVFFDPGSAFTPFGMLPWSETGVQGLKLDKEGGSWLTTPLPGSGDSVTQRKADLHLSDEGDLEGKLTVTYTGLEASQRRLEEHLADAADRKKYLEDEVKGSIPAACEVELTNSPEWSSSATPLAAEFTLKIPGWAAGAGRRVLLTVGVFGAPEKHLFDHAEREYPIYFQFPFQRVDDVKIELPAGWQISTPPAPRSVDAKAIVYTMTAKNSNGALQLSRTLDVKVLLLPVEHYANLRKVFQLVRTGDEQQVILLPGASAAGS